MIYGIWWIHSVQATTKLQDVQVFVCELDSCGAVLLDLCFRPTSTRDVVAKNEAI